MKRTKRIAWQHRHRQHRHQKIAIEPDPEALDFDEDHAGYDNFNEKKRSLNM
jgi:hypothetical protein